MARAISGSVSASVRCMPPSLCELRRPGKDGAAASGMNERLYYRGMAPSVTISARGEQRVRAGHPWIYRTDVVEVDAQAGDLVQVLGPRRRGIGHALFSDRSQIAIRMLSRGDGPLDDSVVRIRIDAAFRYRESLQLDASAYRVVHGEADLLPSLVVDKYGDYLVVQTLSQGMDRLLPTIVRDLIALIAPAGIL